MGAWGTGRAGVQSTIRSLTNTRDYLCTSCQLVVILLLAGCTGEQVEQLVFKESIEYQLKNDCGEDDKECQNAVEEQIEDCMEKSDWQSYLQNDEDPAELQRFVDEFFPCFKDPDGNAYF